MLKAIGTVIVYCIIIITLMIGAVLVWVITGGSSVGRERLSNNRPFIEVGNISTERAEFGWNIYHMRVICQEGAVAIGLAGRTALALNGHTASLARRGLSFTNAEGRKVEILATDLPILIANGLVRPRTEAIEANKPIAAARDRALARCGT
ncbi:MAG: hypothetical protein IOC54_14325 [Methylobacterium sp.]|jgi:hypothetical protein|nr:hypothetical protein [Methylobacterium sp.]MCA3652997.1 hypothetical protein [Methylobacterium sp.]